ncbi:MAG: hypothetical protein DHS20C18_25780 [Saprospiraceae bacterium]|nr:MAG: hypothetical protein DHS20C18_25780 [Saprospiraceae bacterium]
MINTTDNSFVSISSLDISEEENLSNTDFQVTKIDDQGYRLILLNLKMAATMR